MIWRRVAIGVSLLLLPTRVFAVQFGAGDEVTLDSIVEDSGTFLQNLFGRGDAAGAQQAAVLGAVLAGLSCGLLGTFVTLRRMALFGDMIGHAVLPGVAVGFILAGHKSPPALVAGALCFGLLAAGVTRWIRARSRIHEDAALGISLSVFYALGIWLLSWITRHPTLSAESSGLKRFLFGNPAVILPGDLWFLASSATVVVVTVVVFFKELLAVTFDTGFADSIGLRRGPIDAGLLLLLTFVIVVSINILGIILVAAMLTIPPATAYLLTRRLQQMAWCSAGLGCVASLVGVWLSAVFHIGAGPAIVCVAFAGLLLAFLFAPQQGLVRTWLAHLRLARRTVRENLLASIFRMQELEERFESTVSIENLARARGESPAETLRLASRLQGSPWGSVRDGAIHLTGAGMEKARLIVRSHRLWELFLSQETPLAADHLHDGAEEIEHHLSEAEIAALERYLEFPERDPHGKSIPSSTPPRSAQRTEEG